MMPNVSPNSSLKTGPTMPAGSVCAMSPMLLRTWYQSVGDLLRRSCCPCRLTKIVVTPARGEAAQEIEMRGLLQLALEPLGDLLQRVLDGRAGPRRLHHHGLDDEGRVLVAAEPEIGEDAGGHRDDHEVDDERAIA